MKPYELLIGVALGGLIAGLLMAVGGPDAFKMKSQETDKPAVSEQPKAAIATTTTAEQLEKQHGVERFFDMQLGVVCYRLIQKNALSCLPLAKTYMPHGENPVQGK